MKSDSTEIYDRLEDIIAKLVSIEGQKNRNRRYLIAGSRYENKVMYYQPPNFISID